MYTVFLVHSTCKFNQKSITMDCKFAIYVFNKFPGIFSLAWMLITQVFVCLQHVLQLQYLKINKLEVVFNTQTWNRMGKQILMW